MKMMVTPYDDGDDDEPDDDDGPDAMMNRLKSADPEYVALVHPNNKKRLVRALEIVESTGRSPSNHFETQIELTPPKLSLFSINLNWDRAVLRQRIAKRIQIMFADGWIDEVKTLLKKLTSKIKKNYLLKMQKLLEKK